MRLFALILLTILFSRSFAQDTIRIDYKPVIRISTLDGSSPKAFIADQPNGIKIACPAMDNDPHMKGLKYVFCEKDGLAKIVKDNEHPGVIWVSPNSKLMKKKNATSISIEVWLIFPSHPVYIAGQWHKDQPFYDKDGKVIYSNAIWATIEQEKCDPGEYRLGTERFAVELK